MRNATGLQVSHQFSFELRLRDRTQQNAIKSTFRLQLPPRYAVQSPQPKHNAKIGVLSVIIFLEPP